MFFLYKELNRFKNFFLTSMQGMGFKGIHITGEISSFPVSVRNGPSVSFGTNVPCINAMEKINDLKGKRNIFLDKKY